jgi:hypothetical protein
MSLLQKQPLTVKINENKVRLIAFLVLLSVIIYLFTSFFFIPILLVLDFGLRSFDLGKFSPFARLSDLLLKTLHVGTKPIYYPPKRFAARIGLAFSIAILVLQILGINSLIVSSVLGFFAGLESLAGICTGCYVCNWLMPVWKKLK